MDKALLERTIALIKEYWGKVSNTGFECPECKVYQNGIIEVHYSYCGYLSILSTLEAELERMEEVRGAFTDLLRSHSWYTNREYNLDTTYNDQSRGYKEEQKALEVLETMYPTYEDMLKALSPDDEGGEGEEG